MDKSELTLERLRTFIRVAERRNLSSVARELRIGQSTVTRHLRELEEAIGVSLLSRTTRRVQVTDEGTRFYERSVQIIRLVEQASDEAKGGSNAHSGTVRVSCTAAFGILHLNEIIFRFQDNYPDIDVDLSLSDKRIDLVHDGVDFAIRLGPLDDSSLRVHSLGSCSRVLVGSPAYFSSRKRPIVPSDLADHEGVRMSNVAGSDVLTLRDPSGQIATVSITGRYRVDLALALRDALVAGRGIGHAHRWLVNDLLLTGQLEQILPRFLLSEVPLNILIVPERAKITRVRLLIDFISKNVSAISGVT